MAWIHELSGWPNFKWENNQLNSKLTQLRHQQGRLLGNMEALGFTLKLETNLETLTTEIIKSSAIEGENLNSEQVRSSIAQRLGVDIGGLTPPDRNINGIVEIMLDATQNFSAPLTKERLFSWHAALFPTGRSGMNPIAVGKWRALETEPMQVVSGPYGKETVHFEAPKAHKLDQEMEVFISWFENTNNIDPVLKAGVAHFWFVTIHPFEDGNGRIARVISDMALARADKMQERFYSLSSQIEKERKHYYDQLEAQQKGNLNITKWLIWFLDCFENALLKAELTLSHVLFKSQLWDKINLEPVNERQRLIINLMLRSDFKGHINTSKYAKLAKCSNDTALRDIQNLKDRNVLIQNPGKGRSTSYRLVIKDELNQLL